MSTFKSLEDFHIPVRQICAPPEPKNKMIELIQVPLTPRTEAINRKAIERLSAPNLGNKNVKAEAITTKQSDHPYTKKLNAMYARSVHFADRAAQRREEWFAKIFRNADHKKNVTISKMEGDPKRPLTDLLESALKENLQFDKVQPSREETKKSDGEFQNSASIPTLFQSQTSTSIRTSLVDLPANILLSFPLSYKPMFLLSLTVMRFMNYLATKDRAWLKISNK
ncbi:hypothetical protein HYALB_00007679 [Hymenoscyphus albidus]|uniref:Uncharacterized protein n=1 Tax=Hymenoscyphus albidus TaxID=595503 RepID=A0A9N9LLL0_9HELO|nr:hypothetical protein HYALB_00007679 [Hymenoscyphus albidus]